MAVVRQPSSGKLPLNAVGKPPHDGDHTHETSASKTINLENVDDIILCTGFSPSLDFLDTSLLTTLQYDRNDSLQPLILHRELIHPDVPGLYFVGMYRGSYFATMELQAVTLIFHICIENISSIVSSVILIIPIVIPTSLLFTVLASSRRLYFERVTFHTKSRRNARGTEISDQNTHSTTTSAATTPRLCWHVF